ncbi:MAG: aspartate kinase [Armatimonadetes bacterium]|nr:aspartate kinase [Armatimonadota bacterium]
MRIRVLKFGGTSVDSHEHRLMAARKVAQAKEAGYAPVVVVSAIGRKGAPYATDTLVEFLRSIDPSVDPAMRDRDLMMACGEIISTVIMAHTLRTLGHSAVPMTGGQAGIYTDEEYGAARIVAINNENVMRIIADGAVPVVAGFQGVHANGNGVESGTVTTLGRGGSDTTAAALGAALGAEAVEIFTDVDGVKTADPDYVPEASTLQEVTYEEVAEIAHQGARVLHPRAAEAAMDYDIPLYVRNTFSDEPGTLVVSSSSRRRFSAVTHTGKVVSLQISAPWVEHKSHLELEMFRLLGMAQVNVQLVSIDQEGFSLAFSREHFPRVRQMLDGLIIPIAKQNEEPQLYILRFSAETGSNFVVQHGLLEKAGMGGALRTVSIEFTEGLTMVSVIAPGYSGEPGVFYEAIKTLNEAGIAVIQAADSDLSLSCLVPESEVHRAVRILHDRFAITA